VKNIKGQVMAKLSVDGGGRFRIPNLLPGRYRVRGYNGAVWSGEKEVKLKGGEEINISLSFEGLPEEETFAYPNPCREEEIIIRFGTGWTDIEKKVKIYNLVGEKVKSVEDAEWKTEDGVYKYHWGLKNDAGKSVASGVYIFILEVKNRDTGEKKRVIKKFAIIK